MPGRVFTAWLPEELVEKMQSAAADAGVSTNRWVMRALDDAVSTFAAASEEDRHHDR
jgi:predicted HicB family RNase H-like nuclease